VATQAWRGSRVPREVLSAALVAVMRMTVMMVMMMNHGVAGWHGRQTLKALMAERTVLIRICAMLARVRLRGGTWGGKGGESA
jgi:hypothetical protein